MVDLLICNYKDDSLICVGCKHAVDHSPIVTTPFGETCDKRRSVCVDKFKECLCIIEELKKVAPEKGATVCVHL